MDASDEEKLLFANDEMSKIKSDESLVGVPFLMLFNKSDIEEHKTKEELGGRLELEAARKERDIIVQECSGKTGDGIWEGLD